ncbi:MAG: hypothetical protein AB4062_17140 [Crocosphaera sp.]
MRHSIIAVFNVWNGFDWIWLEEIPVNPLFSQNLRSPTTKALQDLGLTSAIADFPNQQYVVRF